MCAARRSLEQNSPGPETASRVPGVGRVLNQQLWLRREVTSIGKDALQGTLGPRDLAVAKEQETWVMFRKGVNPEPRPHAGRRSPTEPRHRSPATALLRSLPALPDCAWLGWLLSRKTALCPFALFVSIFQEPFL